MDHCEGVPCVTSLSTFAHVSCQAPGSLRPVWRERLSHRLVLGNQQSHLHRSLGAPQEGADGGIGLARGEGIENAYIFRACSGHLWPSASCVDLLANI